VLVGYLTGIALIMIAGQLENVTGVPVDGSTFLTDVASFARHLGQVDVPTLLLSAAVLAFLLAAALLLPRVPGPLLAVLLAAAATAMLSLDQLGVRVIGAVPEGLPGVRLPPVAPADLADLMLPAIGVAIVAYSDNVLTARAFATKRGHILDADQEMLALGAANIATGFLQGFPVSSSGSRTVIGDALGSRSQLASLVTLLAVVAVLVSAGPVLAAFPTAALGALVVYAALRLIEAGEFRRFARFRRSELAIALATTVAVLAVGVLYGVLVAVALSILDLLRRVSRPHDGILGFVPGLAGMHDVDGRNDRARSRRLPVRRPAVLRQRRGLPAPGPRGRRRRPDPHAVAAAQLEAVIEIDITAADAAHGLCDELDRRGVVPALARVKQDLMEDLRPSGLSDRIGPNRIFPTLPTAVSAYQEEQRCTSLDMP
jgi:SulP family sulfate permease